MKRSGSLESCFVFEEFNQEDLELSELISNEPIATNDLKVISIGTVRMISDLSFYIGSTTGESLFALSNVESVSGSINNS